jgi:hypothetical protein
MIAMSLFAAVAIAQPATAGSAPPDDSSPIVVTGRRNDAEDMRNFVRAVTHTRPGVLPSRFEQSVCPAALGLPPAQAAAVARRMRRIAREVGIPVGGERCAPNVVVMVTRDKQAFLDELNRKHAQYFGQLSRSQVRKLSRQPGPAVAWQTQGAPVSARGVELFYDPAFDAYVNKTTEAPSRISAGARPQYDGAVVVVERRALAGLTVTQLADYAAMRSFAGADPRRLPPTSLPTILRVLEAPMGTAVPLSMTQWDLAFLRGFYSAPRNINTAGQRSAIDRSMQQDLDRAKNQ